jgi:tetratricopeptide (TPR) repeat protein
MRSPALHDGKVHPSQFTMMTFAQNSADFWHGRGCSLCEAEDYTNAIAAFDQAIALEPTHCQAWSNRANALCGLNRYAEAIAAYDKAIALQPSYHQAWFNRGLAFAEMGAYGNAAESYERAIALHADPRYLHAKEGIWHQQKLVVV